MGPDPATLGVPMSPLSKQNQSLKGNIRVLPVAYQCFRAGNRLFLGSKRLSFYRKADRERWGLRPPHPIFVQAVLPQVVTPQKSTISGPEAI
jgi:hypothetical protein